MCDNTCKWGLPSDPCVGRATSLTISTTVGGMVNDEFALTPTSNQIGKLSAFSCPASSISTFTFVSYSYVQIINPSAKAATVTLWSGPAFSGPTLNLNMAVYARSTAPVTDADRKACTVSNTGCSASPCDSGGNWAGFVGANTLKIPAGTTMMLHVYPDAMADTGIFQIFARTDALN